MVIIPLDCKGLQIITNRTSAFHIKGWSAIQELVPDKGYSRTICEHSDIFPNVVPVGINCANIQTCEESLKKLMCAVITADGQAAVPEAVMDMGSLVMIKDASWRHPDATTIILDERFRPAAMMKHIATSITGNGVWRNISNDLCVSASLHRPCDNVPLRSNMIGRRRSPKRLDRGSRDVGMMMS